MIIKNDCTEKKTRPSYKVCDACGNGPCYCHDCTLGNWIVNYNVMGAKYPPRKRDGRWVVYFQRRSPPKDASSRPDGRAAKAKGGNP
jgi:hypothetical protein